jgi:hypothetical protein
LNLTKKIGKGWYPYPDLTKALVLKRGIWFRSAIVYMRGRRKEHKNYHHSSLYDKNE